MVFLQSLPASQDKNTAVHSFSLFTHSCRSAGLTSGKTVKCGGFSLLPSSSCFHSFPSVMSALDICLLSLPDPFCSVDSKYILRMNGHMSNWAFDFKPFITKCEIMAIRLPGQGI